MGYTGGSNPDPSYESVCGGDGHTEAVKIDYDPAVISYEALMHKVLKQASPPGWGGKQYQSAVWAQNEEQAATARRVAASLGKTAVPVLSASAWHDAENYHQKYFEKARR